MILKEQDLHSINCHLYKADVAYCFHDYSEVRYSSLPSVSDLCLISTVSLRSLLLFSLLHFDSMQVMELSLLCGHSDLKCFMILKNLKNLHSFYVLLLLSLLKQYFNLLLCSLYITYYIITTTDNFKQKNVGKFQVSDIICSLSPAPPKKISKWVSATNVMYLVINDV